MSTGNSVGAEHVSSGAVATAPAGTTGSRPGGRSARIRAAVHTAVTELLAEEAPESMTFPIIAARAGVHATTLYRRWGSLADLLADVANSRFSGPNGEVVVPDTGSLRGDLRQWATDVATDLQDPDVLALIRATIGAGERGGCVCRGDRMQQLDAMISRESDRGGEVIPSEEAADSLLGPLYFRALFTEEPGSTTWARSLVDKLL